MPSRSRPTNHLAPPSCMIAPRTKFRSTRSSELGSKVVGTSGDSLEHAQSHPGRRVIPLGHSGGLFRAPLPGSFLPELFCPHGRPKFAGTIATDLGGGSSRGALARELCRCVSSVPSQCTRRWALGRQRA